MIANLDSSNNFPIVNIRANKFGDGEKERA